MAKFQHYRDGNVVVDSGGNLFLQSGGGGEEENTRRKIGSDSHNDLHNTRPQSDQNRDPGSSDRVHDDDGTDCRLQGHHISKFRLLN